MTDGRHLRAEYGGGQGSSRFPHHYSAILSIIRGTRVRPVKSRIDVLPFDTDTGLFDMVVRMSPERDDGGRDWDPTARRRRAAVWLTVAATAVSGVGVVASTWIKSPDQAAADSRPPTPSVLTAPVVRRVLTETLVLRGTFAAARQISAAPTSVAATADGPGASALIVTAVKLPAGSAVKSGQVVLEYSGRPLFPLPGAIPAYRDLTPGERGADVAQLQQALISLGHPDADAAGYFGAGTKAAVTAFYSAIGYPTPVTGPSTTAAVSAAQLSVVHDQQTIAALTAQGAAGAGQLSAARAALTADQTALTQAEALDGPMVPMSEAVFLPSFPARIQNVDGTVGSKVDGTLVAFECGGLVLTGQLQPGDQNLIKTGMSASVLSEATGATATGTVGTIGAQSPAAGQDSDAQGSGGQGASGQGAAGQGGTDQDGSGQDGSGQGGTGQDGTGQDGTGQNGGSGAGSGSALNYIPVVIKPGAPWDPGFDGQNVRVTITAAGTSGPVLVVPEAAITTGADGGTRVTVESPTGTEDQVTVTAGVSADGYVAVAPTGPGLAAGDRVVIGG